MSSSFITVDFTTDPGDLETAAVELLRTNIPGWEPADGNLDVWLLAAMAQQASETTAVAAQVPPSIFRAFGTQLIGVAPLAGVAATIPTTWTLSDALGHTIPAGTQVGYRVSGDTLIVFEVVADTLIPPGSTSLSPVVLQAVEIGSTANGVPSGPLELVDSLSWVSSVSANSAASGGVDAETDTAYLDRLTVELRLLTPRPILPDDFSVLARNVTGVARALTVNGYDPGLDEHQSVTITGSPTGGTFTLTFSAQTTSAIAYNASASTVQAALVALSSVGAGGVTVTGGPLPGAALDVEFTGPLAVTNVAAMTAASSLTGGSSPAVTIATTTGGVAPSSGNERMVTVFPIDTAGAACGSTIRGNVQTYLDGLREVTFVVHVATPTYTTINVSYTIHVSTGYNSAAVITAVNAALTAYLSPGNWAGGTQSPPVWTAGETSVRFLLVANVIQNVLGVAYLASLTVNSGTSDVTLSGTAPLPAVGTISGSAV